MYKRIRDLREDNDLTQEEVSKKLNISQKIHKFNFNGTKSNIILL